MSIPSYRPQRSATPRMAIDPEIIQAMAREFATERLRGVIGGQAWFQEFKRRGERIARKHGQSWAELYAAIHKAAYAVIDVDPRARLG
jgi:hypothetical protein